MKESSSQEDQAMEKQCGSHVEEPCADAVMRRPGRGRGNAAKRRRGQEVPRTGSSGAKQEGMAETRHEH